MALYISTTTSINELVTTRAFALQIEQEKNTNKIISICHTLDANINNIEQHLIQTANAMQRKKDEMDIKLHYNRQRYADVTNQMHSKENEINRLRSELKMEESQLTDLQKRIDDLQNDINAKEREKKLLEKKVLYVGIGLGVASVFTFGVSGAAGALTTAAAYATIAVLISEISTAIRKVNDLRNVQNNTHNRIQNVRNEISSKQTEKHAYYSQKSSLQSEKYSLDRESKQLGRNIVCIGNVVKNVKAAKTKCEKVVIKIDMVRELAQIELCELIKDPLRELIMHIDAARNDLMIAY